MSRRLAIAIAGMSAAGLLGACAFRAHDSRDADQAWALLAAQGGRNQALFAPEMVAGLPDPARRYFLFAIAPGTPLRTVVELDMVGEIGLGNKEQPNYQPMVAREVLAPPHGFV
jgi:hypothetical protein